MGSQRESPTPADHAARVLIVDADADMRGLYREAFALLGCYIVEASDGRDALVKGLVRRPTLVVTELQLPLMGGLTLCEILRRDHITNNVPILVVTNDVGAVERARAAGASGVLIKPVTHDTILLEGERLLAQVDDRPSTKSEVNPHPESSTAPLHRSGRKTRLSKSHTRFATTTPPVSPPPLNCPRCDRVLVYTQSYIGGVNAQHSEQWDEYRCDAGCGTFEYRHRTRTLRTVA
jgi:two-component system chemotaxis response regulator CheY